MNPLACTACGACDVPLQRCQQCQRSAYCSALCQKTGWVDHGHSLVCAKYAGRHGEDEDDDDEPAAKRRRIQDTLPRSELEQLPAEMIMAITYPLPLHDILALMKTNKALHGQLEVVVWRLMLQRDILGPLAKSKHGRAAALAAIIPEGFNVYAQKSALELRRMYMAVMCYCAETYGQLVGDLTTKYYASYRTVEDHDLIRIYAGGDFVVGVGYDNASMLEDEGKLVDRTPGYLRDQWPRLSTEGDVFDSRISSVIQHSDVKYWLDALNRNLALERFAIPSYRRSSKVETAWKGLFAALLKHAPGSILIAINGHTDDGQEVAQNDFEYALFNYGYTSVGLTTGNLVEFDHGWDDVPEMPPQQTMEIQRFRV